MGRAIELDEYKIKDFLINLKHYNDWELNRSDPNQTFFNEPTSRTFMDTRLALYDASRDPSRTKSKWKSNSLQHSGQVSPTQQLFQSWNSLVRAADIDDSNVKDLSRLEQLITASHFVQNRSPRSADQISRTIQRFLMAFQTFVSRPESQRQLTAMNKMQTTTNTRVSTSSSTIQHSNNTRHTTTNGATTENTVHTGATNVNISVPVHISSSAVRPGEEDQKGESVTWKILGYSFQSVWRVVRFLPSCIQALAEWASHIIQNLARFLTRQISLYLTLSPSLMMILVYSVILILGLVTFTIGKSIFPRWVLSWLIAPWFRAIPSIPKSWPTPEDISNVGAQITNITGLTSLLCYMPILRSYYCASLAPVELEHILLIDVADTHFDQISMSLCTLYDPIVQSVKMPFVIDDISTEVQRFTRQVNFANNKFVMKWEDLSEKLENFSEELDSIFDGTHTYSATISQFLWSVHRETKSLLSDFERRYRQNQRPPPPRAFWQIWQTPFDVTKQEEINREWVRTRLLKYYTNLNKELNTDVLRISETLWQHYDHSKATAKRILDLIHMEKHAFAEKKKKMYEETKNGIPVTRNWLFGKQDDRILEEKAAEIWKNPNNIEHRVVKLLENIEVMEHTTFPLASKQFSLSQSILTDHKARLKQILLATVDAEQEKLPVFSLELEDLLEPLRNAVRVLRERGAEAEEEKRVFLKGISDGVKERTREWNRDRKKEGRGDL